MDRRGRKLIFSVLVVGAAVALPAPPAGALNVVNVSSTVDGAPGSLRDAFDTANTDGDDTEIVLQTGATYELTTCPGTDEDDNVDGDLDHTRNSEDLTITGNGAVIRQTCADERVIDVESSGLRITDVTITGGDALEEGGGLRGDELTLERVLVTGNHADETGGGVAANGGTVIDSTITQNTSDEEGGGLDLSAGGTVVVVQGTTISDNTAGFEGGGLYAGGGGGQLTLTDSTITGNTGRFEGGGVAASGGSYQATVVGTTFAGNTVLEGVGGGLRSGGGSATLAVTNSTFSANTASHGGGLAVGGGTQTITHVTFADNVAIISGSQLSDHFGPDDPGFSAVTLFGTVLAGGADTCALSSPATSAGHNHVTDGSCALGGPGDVEGGGDPELEPLGDNGGPTPTRLPGFTSPLVDAIAVADCSPTVTDDQRDVARPQEAGCDIGAVEGRGDEVVPPPDPPEPPGPQPPDVDPIAATPTFTG